MAPPRFLFASLVVHAAVFAGAALVVPGRAVRRAPEARFHARTDAPPAVRAEDDLPIPPSELPARSDADEWTDVPPDREVDWIPDAAFATALAFADDPLRRTPRPQGARPPSRRAPDFDPAGADPPGGPPAVPEPPPRAEPVRVRAPRTTRARLLSSPAPAYPESARAAGAEGVVRLRVEVLEDGAVGEVEIVGSSGSTVLDDAAVAAVRSWRFEPATADGAPRRVRVDLGPIRFLIRG